MATKPVTITEPKLGGGKGYEVVIASWSLANGDDGEPVALPHFPDCSIQAVGNFGGGSASLEGTLDGQNWAPLHDAQGNAIGLTVDGIKFVTEVCLKVRPKLSGGAGGSLTFMMLFRRPVG